ncbi:MAG: metallophosphoesterase [Candidatus Shapirobacteria bacterium]
MLLIIVSFWNPGGYCLIWIADLHIGLNKDNSVFHQTTLELFDEIIEVCKKNNEDRIVVLGDFFHSRKTISQKSLEIARRIIKKCADNSIILVLIRGNHDSLSDTTPFPNWLTNLNAYENVIVVEDEPFVLENNFTLVPWNCSLKSVKTQFVLGHFAINSFPMNNGYECEESNLNLSNFKKFKRVWSGHFHNPMTKENVTYIGSPFQNNFGDVDSVRGYYLVQNENSKFIEFTKAPKFYKISTEDLDKSKIPGNFIKLVFEKDYGITKNNEFIEKVEALNPLLLVTDTSRIREDSSVEVLNEEVMNSNEEILFDYLEKQEIPKYLDKKILIKFVDKMLKEA